MVHRRQQPVRRGGQDRAGPQVAIGAGASLFAAGGLAARRLSAAGRLLAGGRLFVAGGGGVVPGVPQPGERQRLGLAGGDVDRLLLVAFAHVLPLVEPVDRDDAPPPGEPALPGFLLAHGLGAQVDHPGTAEASLAHLGTSPQRSLRSWRAPSALATITRMSLAGVTFQLGWWPSTPTGSAWNCSPSSDGWVEELKRPHMPATVAATPDNPVVPGPAL